MQRPIEFATTEWERCRDNPIYFIEKYCELPIPHEWQKAVIYTSSHTWAKQRNLLMALPRTSGKTQVICGLALHRLVFGTNETVVISTIHGNMGNRILETVKYNYDRLPEMFKPIELRRNQNGWTLGTNTVRVCLDSRHLEGLQPPTLLLLDDPGLIPQHMFEEFVSLRSKRTVMLGTPNGKNHFHAAFIRYQLLRDEWLVMQIGADDIENYKIPSVAQQIQPERVFRQQYYASFDDA
jgi:hypothetical protein